MKTPILILTLVLGSALAQAQSVVGYQYWYDGNFAARTTVNVSPTSVLNLTANLATSNLGTGLHSVALRVFDDSLRYSVATHSHHFYYNTAGGTVVAYTYWFDGDVANAQTTTITPATHAVLPLSIACATLYDGIHVLHFRVKDFGGYWSATTSGIFHKRGGAGSGQVFQITAMRYWFDGNAASAQSISLTAAPTLNTTIHANAAALTDGNHFVTWQLQDQTGTWSEPVSENFFKRGNSTNVAVELSAYRYWFDQPTQVPTEIALANPAVTVNLSQLPACNALSKNWHHIYYQLKDRGGIWSTAITDSFYRNAAPVAAFTVQNPTVCVGLDSVHFVNQAQEADSVYWTFGDGNHSSLWQPDNLYAQTGQFAVTQTAIDKATGFSNTQTQTNAVDVRGLPVSNFTFLVNNLNVQFTNQSVWATSYVWDFGDGTQSALENPQHTYAQSGTYQVELLASGFCGNVFKTQSVMLVFGLNEEAINQLKVYPNPATDWLTIELRLRQAASVSVHIYNLLGKVVWQQKTDGKTLTVDERIDVSAWPKGIYILKVELLGENRMFRIVVQ